MVRTPIQQATQGAAHTANHARTLADPRSASDQQGFPSYPVAGERSTQMLREIWPGLTPQDRESWVAHVSTRCGIWQARAQRRKPNCAANTRLCVTRRRSSCWSPGSRTLTPAVFKNNRKRWSIFAKPETRIVLLIKSCLHDASYRP